MAAWVDAMCGVLKKALSLSAMNCAPSHKRYQKERRSPLSRSLTFFAMSSATLWSRKLEARA